MKVLLAEDDRDFGNILSQYVTINGFDVTLARDGNEAWELFNQEKPDICVLDVMMPEMDGFTLGEKIKGVHPDVPLIFLTAKSLKEDIVRGLKIGADDYITKPFDPEVLILRINNILKRAYSSSNDEFRVSNTVLNFNTLELICGNTKEKLTLKEALLLKYFIVNKNKVLAREDILTEIWGEDDCSGFIEKEICRYGVYGIQSCSGIAPVLKIRNMSPGKLVVSDSLYPVF